MLGHPVGYCSRCGSPSFRSTERRCKAVTARGYHCDGDLHLTRLEDWRECRECVGDDCPACGGYGWLLTERGRRTYDQPA